MITRKEALRRVLGRFQVGVRTVSVDFDPAGSSYEYAPSSSDLEILEVILGRPIQESELWFSVGCGPYASSYSIPKPLVEELVAAIEIPSNLQKGGQADVHAQLPE